MRFVRRIGVVLIGIGCAGPLGAASDGAALLDTPRSMDAPSTDGARDTAPPSEAGDPAGTWRSTLFPAGWQPVEEGGARDAAGRYLPDFSYAGWHRGETQPPWGVGVAVATVDPALGDGATDATAAIQAAIDHACMIGGGVVLIPAGTYRVHLPSASATEILRIGCSHLVLRGASPATTRILVDEPTRMRNRRAIFVGGTGWIWDSASTTTHALASDASAPTFVIALATPASLAVGDWIAARNQNGDPYRIAHRMDQATSGQVGLWPDPPGFRGLVYPRRIVAIAGTNVTLDAPVRQDLLLRDHARAYRLDRFIEDVGLESFSIGMVENTTTSTRTEPSSDNDYMVVGTTGYEVHASTAIELDTIHDAWIHDVDTFAPAGNAMGSHVLSNGFLLADGAFRITVDGCDLAHPEYRGGGGNGYLVHVAGSDMLILRTTTTIARHGFIINDAASGNVFREVTTTRSRYSDDSHRFLAHANLYDRVTLEGGWLQAVNRGTDSGGAGFTSTNHVFWGVHVVSNHATARGCAVESAQFGDGYMIGSVADPGATARFCPTSFSNSYWATLDPGAPADFVEGEGMAETLWPRSLHAAQLALRCARARLTCTPW